MGQASGILPAAIAAFAPPHSTVASSSAEWVGGMARQCESHLQDFPDREWVSWVYVPVAHAHRTPHSALFLGCPCWDCV